MFHDGLGRAVNTLIDILAGILNHIPGMGGQADSLEKAKIAMDGLATASENGVKRQNDINEKYAHTGQVLSLAQQSIEDTYQKNLAALDPMKASLANFADTGTIGGIFGQLANGIMSAVTNAAKTLSTPSSGTSASGSADVQKATFDYQKQIVDSERNYGQQRIDAQRQFQIESVKAELDYQQGIAKQKADAARSSHEQNMKALVDFNHNETLIKKKQDFDRLQAEKQFGASQLELAAQGDVAAYISAQKSRTFEVAQQDRQNTYDATTRKAQYDWDTQQRHIQEEQSLRDSLADGAKAHAQQLAASQVAYDNQLAQIKTEHGLQLEALKRGYADQLVALGTNIAGLNDIQTAYYAKQTAQMNDFFKSNSMIDGLKAMYAKSIGAAAPGSVNAASADKMIGGTQGQGSVVRGSSNFNIPSHAGGLAQVPYDGYIASLHKGEKVLTAAQASQGGSKSITVNVGGVTIGAGNGVTRDYVDKSMHDVADRIASAMERAN
jgi:hypothetical protein